MIFFVFCWSQSDWSQLMLKRWKTVYSWMQTTNLCVFHFVYFCFSSKACFCFELHLDTSWPVFLLAVSGWWVFSLFTSLFLVSSRGKPSLCLSWLSGVCDWLSGFKGRWFEGRWLWTGCPTSQPSNRWPNTETNIPYMEPSAVCLHFSLFLFTQPSVFFVSCLSFSCLFRLHSSFTSSQSSWSCHIESQGDCWAL